MKPLTSIVLALLLWNASSSIRGQQVSTQELNRVYLCGPTHLLAIELDGSIAWSVPHGGFLGGGVGPAIDPRGHIWLPTVLPSGFVINRWSTQGVLEFTVPIMPFALDGSGLWVTSIDRDGSCYVGKWIYNTLAPYSRQSHLVKISAQGQVLWDRDLTPQVLLSNPPVGVLRDHKVDEDGNVWVCLGSASYGWQGGRLLKLDPQGNVLLSIQAGGDSIQLNADRTLRVFNRTAGVCPGYACVARYTLEGVFLGEGTDWCISNLEGALLAHASGICLHYAYGSPSIEGLAPGPLAPTGLGFQQLPATLIGGPVVHLVLDPLGRVWSIGRMYTPWNLTQWYAVRYEFPAGPTSPYVASTLTPLGPPVYTPSGTANPGKTGSLYEYALITDPWGDLDGDGIMNRNEILAGTNPCDPQSRQGTLTVSGLAPGQTASFQISAPGDAGLSYATVLGSGMSRIRLADDRFFGPSPLDPLGQWWWSPSNALVSGAIGTLGGSGQGQATVAIPNVPSLAGIPISFGYATLDPQWSQGLKTLYGPVEFLIGGGGGP